MFRRQDGVPDLVMATSTDNASIANHLGTRLKRKEIYTCVGSVLIACNPFVRCVSRRTHVRACGMQMLYPSLTYYGRLPIYGDDYIKMYSNAVTSDTPPHIFDLAERAYRRMVSLERMAATIRHHNYAATSALLP